MSRRRNDYHKILDSDLIFCPYVLNFIVNMFTKEIVIETIHLFELTCPSEHNIEQRHTEKSNKYAHFITDVSEYKCKVDAFEVSSKGFLTTRNHTTLATLHKFINPAIKLQHFKKNISALSLVASYHIFNCKSEPTFVEPPFLLPPIKI